MNSLLPQNLDTQFWISAGGGALLAIILFTLVSVIRGLKMNLYLIDDDEDVDDANRSMMQITAENKLRGFWKAFFKGQWRENIDVTLADYKNNSFIFQVGYRLITRYYFMPLGHGKEAPRLNGRPMSAGKRYAVRTGSILTLGSRRFRVAVLPAGQALVQEFAMLRSNSGR